MKTYDDYFTDAMNNIAGIDNWMWNDTGVEVVIKNPNDERVVFKQALDFFDSYKIDLLKEANLKTIWNTLTDKTYDNAIIEIASLTAPELKKIIGSNGTKIAESMSTRLTSSGLATFLGASKYMGIGFGVRKAKALLKGMKNPLVELEQLTLDDITEKDGFDTKTATAVIAGIPPSMALLNKMIGFGLIDIVEKEVQTSNYDLEHLNVVMTGFRDQSLQDSIESRGGKVSSGISKKTSHVLCLDPNSSSGKMQKAKELGVVAMTPDDFKLEYGIR